MLETLISSRIRRALFEHILTHPSERFYLRGLAKSLQLSVSPLRRELKRLERSGMLQAAQEGNMLFYAVNTQSPSFLQLQQASQTKAPSPSVPASDAPASGVGLAAQALLEAPRPALRRSLASWRTPLPGGALIGAAGVGVALLVVVASLLYIRLTDRTLLSGASRALTTQTAEVIIVPQETSSGAMHGSRWRIVPGGFGGFSSSASTNSEAF